MKTTVRLNNLPMALTIPLSSPGSRPVILKPVVRLSQVRQWQETLDYFDSEVNFYRRLLAVGIYNCSPKSKLIVAELLLNFTRLEQVILPDLRTVAGNFSGFVNEDAATIYAFEKKLNATSEQVKQLKTQVFPLLSEMQKITFW